MMKKYYRIETEIAVEAEDEDECDQIAMDVKDLQEGVLLNQGEAITDYACIATTTDGYMGRNTGNL